jgi:hypothetical protein
MSEDGRSTPRRTRFAWSHRVSLLVAAMVLAGLSGFAGTALAASPHVTGITGTWSCCGSGGAGTQTWTISESASGSLSGSASSSGGTFASISGSVSGDSVRIVTTYNSFDPGYVATFTGTVSADGTTMSGDWESNQSQSGTWTASLTSSLRTSATLVNCNLWLDTGAPPFFDCTASVSDASSDSPPAIPTGTVQWALTTPGQGSFPYGATCTLQPQADTAVSDCSVVYVPPASGIPPGSQPPIAAGYSGDSALASSTGVPSALLQGSTDPLPTSQDMQVADLTADLCMMTPSAPGDKASAAGDGSGPVPGNDGSGRVEFLTLQPNQYSPTAGFLETAATALGNGTAHVVNILPTCIGGLTYLAGSVTSALTPEPNGTVQKLEVAGGAIGSLFGGPEIGAGTLGVITVQYTVQKPIGDGLASLGSYIMNDPPDAHFRTVARPAPVPAIKLPAGSGADARALFALRMDTARFVALKKAFITSIDRIGGAKRAHNRRFTGVQQRAALRYDRQAVTELRDVLKLLPEVQAMTVRDLTSHGSLSLAQFRAAQARLRRHGFTRSEKKLLRELGLNPARVLAAALALKPGTVFPATPQINPRLPELIKTGIGVLHLYRLDPQVIRQAALH